MKKFIYILIIFITNVLIIGASCYFLIKPGIENVNNANKIKVLSANEIAEKKESINHKYQDLYDEINGKYITLNNDLENEYSNKATQIDQKYLQLEQEIRGKYHKQMLEDGWYEEQIKMQSEISNLNSQKNSEKSALKQEKWSKETNLSNKKREETNNLNEKKEAELSTITNNSDIKTKKYILGTVLIILGSIVIAIDILILIYMFNKMIRCKNNVKKAWANVETQLKRRYDLIPNLVEVVKDYSHHEEDTLVSVIKARKKTSSINEEIEMNSKVDNTMQTIMALKEDYPELKANDNYQTLMSQLKEVEDELSFARTNYNSAVEKYKNARETIPTNVIAEIFQFKDMPFYEVSNDKERENVKIKL